MNQGVEESGSKGSPEGWRDAVGRLAFSVVKPPTYKFRKDF